MVFQRANFTGINLKKANLRGVGLYRCNLKDATIKEEQLAYLNDLRFCTLPDGTFYDGRYCLKGDIDWALSKYKVDFNAVTLEAMADYYGVSVADFVIGQRWAKENLNRFSREVPHYLANLDLGDTV